MKHRIRLALSGLIIALAPATGALANDGRPVPYERIITLEVHQDGALPQRECAQTGRHTLDKRNKRYGRRSCVALEPAHPADRETD